MKKLLLILVSFFYGIIFVQAATYYSEYSEFSDWSNEEVVESDVLIVEKERRYKYYHEEVIGDYFLEGTAPEEFNLVDKNNFKTTDISEWSQVKPKEEINRVVDMRRVYEVSKVLPVRYIKIDNPYGGYGCLRFTEIEVKSSGEKINYSVQCNTCSDNFEYYIKNGITNENFSHVMNNGSFIIDLGGYYPFESVTVTFYLYDVTPDVKSFHVMFYRDLNGPIYTEKNVSLSFSSSSLDNIKNGTWAYTNMDTNTLEWSEPVISLTKPIATYTTKVTELLQYNYYDILYYYYKIDREYSDIETEYYNKKDEEQYIDYFRYKRRDKIVISDNNEIISGSQSENDFILETTVPVSIEGTVNKEVNGKYPIKYITPFITVEKEIVINISDEMKLLEKTKNELTSKIDEINNLTLKQNAVNDYNSLIEELNIYKIELNRVNSELEKYKSDLEIKENEKKIISKEYENQIINIKLEKDKKIEELSNQVRETNTHDKWPLLKIDFKKEFLIIPVLLIISIIIYFIKYKKKN